MTALRVCGKEEAPMVFAATSGSVGCCGEYRCPPPMRATVAFRSAVVPIR